MSSLSHHCLVDSFLFSVLNSTLYTSTRVREEGKNLAKKILKSYKQRNEGEKEGEDDDVCFLNN